MLKMLSFYNSRFVICDYVTLRLAFKHWLHDDCLLLISTRARYLKRFFLPSNWEAM